jgi:hypothetical protein
MYYNADRQDLVRSLIVYGLKCFVLSFELLRLLHERFTQSLDGAPFSFNSAIFSLLILYLAKYLIIVAPIEDSTSLAAFLVRLQSGLEQPRDPALNTLGIVNVGRAQLPR